MKIQKKICITLIIAFLLCGCFCSLCFADLTDPGITIATPSTAETLSGRVLGIAQVICWVAAVILIMWMGIKWLSAAPEGKASLKKGLISALIAVILLVGAGSIIGFVNKGTAEMLSESGTDADTIDISTDSSEKGEKKFPKPNTPDPFVDILVENKPTIDTNTM